MVKVIEVNSGDVGDQVAMASPGTPSTVQGRIVDVPGASPAPQSWADALAVGANSGPVSPVLDVPIQSAPGVEFHAQSVFGYRQSNNGATALHMNVSTNQIAATAGSVLTRGISSSSPARWIQPLYFTATFFSNFADSAVSGANINLLINNVFTIGPFLSAGNVSAVGVAIGTSPGGVLLVGQSVTVEVRKNGVAWLTIVCAGDDTRAFWSYEGSLATANQFAAGDGITARATLTFSTAFPSVIRPRVTVMLGLRVGGV